MGYKMKLKKISIISVLNWSSNTYKNIFEDTTKNCWIKISLINFDSDNIQNIFAVEMAGITNMLDVQTESHDKRN